MKDPQNIRIQVLDDIIELDSNQRFRIVIDGKDSEGKIITYNRTNEETKQFVESSQDPVVQITKITTDTLIAMGGLLIIGYFVYKLCN